MLYMKTVKFVPLENFHEYGSTLTKITATYYFDFIPFFMTSDRLFTFSLSSCVSYGCMQTNKIQAITMSAEV